MAGVILALLEHPETTPGLLAAAARLAELMDGARIDGLVVRTPPETTILPSEEVLTDLQAAHIRQQEHARATAVREAFDQWFAGGHSKGNAAHWCDVECALDDAVTEWGSRADIIVLPRPTGDDYIAARREIHLALFGTGRPVLIVPPGPPSVAFGHRVAIAWRADRYATKAVLSAMRSRVRPERVFVLAGLQEGSPSPSIPEVLTEHAVEAELHLLPIGPGTFGATLLAKAHELGADLLIMGAYQHSPLRELLLGGVTRYMLGHSDLPVLMRH